MCFQDLRASASVVFDSHRRFYAGSFQQSASGWVSKSHWISVGFRAGPDRQPPSRSGIGVDPGGYRSSLRTQIEVLRFLNWGLRRRTWVRMERRNQDPDQWLHPIASASAAPGNRRGLLSLYPPSRKQHSRGILRTHAVQKSAYRRSSRGRWWWRTS